MRWRKMEGGHGGGGKGGLGGKREGWAWWSM